jgi:hypothetical protein
LLLAQVERVLTADQTQQLLHCLLLQSAEERQEVPHRREQRVVLAAAAVQMVEQHRQVVQALLDKDLQEEVR